MGVSSRKSTGVVGGNLLDSSAPSVRRRKEREAPKNKRKSKVKRVILADRERRRQERIRNLEKRR